MPSTRTKWIAGAGLFEAALEAGALNESALRIAQQPEESGALKATMDVIVRYLDGLRGGPDRAG